MSKEEIKVCNTIFKQHNTSTYTLHKGVSNRCWNCHHSFKTQRISIPMNFEEMHGTFCSLECAKSYIYSMKRYDESKLLLSLSYVYDNYNIRCAPNFTFLKAYGGHLSIEEYRNQGGISVPKALTKPYITWPTCMHTVETNNTEEEKMVPLYEEYLKKKTIQNTNTGEKKKKGTGTLSNFLS